MSGRQQINDFRADNINPCLGMSGDGISSKQRECKSSNLGAGGSPGSYLKSLLGAVNLLHGHRMSPVSCAKEDVYSAHCLATIKNQGSNFFCWRCHGKQWPFQQAVYLRSGSDHNTKEREIVSASVGVVPSDGITPHH